MELLESRIKWYPGCFETFHLFRYVDEQVIRYNHRKDENGRKLSEIKAGYLMIEQVAIQNFRCFSSLQVSGLKRINVIVGGSASGKTAFLEALFLNAGAAAPNIAFQLRALRQLGNQIQIVPEVSAYEGLWRDLFHWFEQDRTISIDAIGNENDSRSLRILYSGTGTQTLPYGKQPVGGGFVPQIVFEWRRGEQEPVVVKPRFAAAGMQFEGGSIEHFPIIFFAPHAADTPEENAKRFSELSKSGKVGPVIDALRAEFPFIDSLSIEYLSNIPTVFASLANRTEKMPVGLISDGVNKLLSILLGISTYPKGTVLIDEFENGFYYERYESIWRTIYAFARFNEAQVFATTHSREFLRALIPTLQANARDFCLLRAEQSASRVDSMIARFEGEHLLSALSKDGEIR